MNNLNNVARKEPAAGIGASVTAILYAVYGILQLSGIVVPDDMVTHVNALVLALCAVPAVSGFLTRFLVYSPNTVDHISHGGSPDGPPHEDVLPANEVGAV